MVAIDFIYKGVILHGDQHYFLQTIFGDIFFLNMFRPDLTCVVSGWSIMDEMLFYLLFPLIIVLRNKHIFVITLLITVSIYIIFDTFILDSSKAFVEQNVYYVSAIFNLPFFLIGISIGILKLNYNTLVLDKKYLAILFLLIILFAALNNKERYIEYILGEYRIYSILLISILILIATFTVMNENNILYNIFEFLARISYSLYLMHFIVFYVLYNLLGLHNIWIIIPLAIGTSYLTYILIEKRFTNYLRAYVLK